MYFLAMLIVGMLIGVCLQRSKVAGYDTQMNMFFFKDMTVIKFILTYMCVKGIWVYFLFVSCNLSVSINVVVFGSNILGSLIFGMGWGLSGYYPIAAIAALGEGYWDTLFVIIGGIVGSLLCVNAYTVLYRISGEKTLIPLLGKIVFSGILHINPGTFLGTFLIFAILLCYFFEKQGL